MYRYTTLAALALLTSSLSSTLAQGRTSSEVFLNETRLETLKLRVKQRTEPTHSAWLDLKARAEGLLDRQPHAPEHWYVPNYWPNDDAAILLRNARPMTARHSVPVLTFIHGNFSADSPGYSTP